MGIKGVAGETLKSYINYLYPNNDPITGASFETVAARRSDGSPFPFTLTEIGNGVYEIVVPTLPTDPAGEWLLTVEANLDGSRFEEVFDIQAVDKPTVALQPVEQSGASRAELRRAIANKLGDFQAVMATAQGQEGMVIDTVNLAQPLNAFNGMQIICTHSAWPQNVGHIANVTSGSPADRSINFEPPMPQVSMPGDTFEMYNYRGQGWRVNDYNLAINNAITRAGDEHDPLPHIVEVERGEYLTIPREFSHLAGVEVLGRNGKREVVPPQFYQLWPSTRELTLTGTYGHRNRSYSKVRIIGYRKPDQLLTDESRTHIPFDWLVYEAEATLLQHDVTMGVTEGQRDRVLAMSRQGADGRRSMVIRSFPPNTRKLP